MVKTTTSASKPARVSPLKASKKVIAKKDALMPKKKEEEAEVHLVPVADESSEGEMSSVAGSDISDVEAEEPTDAFTGSAAEITLTGKIRKNMASKPASGSEKPGVVYLGRIPHGFYEDQMRAYFSQFGEVTRLRLSRNKKTGASKHYAFIEFKHEDVAQVVADTMNNYLLFEHILKCRVVPEEKQHEDMWVGANKKFKVLPHAKINREQHNKVKTAEEHQKNVKALLSREQRLRDKLAEMGIDYDFPGYASSVKKDEQAKEAKEEKPKGDMKKAVKKVEAAKPKEPKAAPKAEKPTPVKPKAKETVTEQKPLKKQKVSTQVEVVVPATLSPTKKAKETMPRAKPQKAAVEKASKPEKKVAVEKVNKPEKAAAKATSESSVRKSTRLTGNKVQSDAVPAKKAIKQKRSADSAPAVTQKKAKKITVGK